jgi:dihydrofolate reductase
MARLVTTHLFASVDGVVESPNLWQFDAFDDRLGQLMGEALARTDAVVLGRTTYEEWAGFWPGMPADDPFAQFVNQVSKYVASRTLRPEDLTWQNTQLIRGDLATSVAELARGEGGDIAVNGSISVVRQLFDAGVLDRLTLTVHPVVAGTGRRLFEPGHDTTRLTLVDQTTTPAGTVVVTYARRD